ncbi:hypothetical protein CSUI_004839 [Cystoisospora suis]|uniref:Uncharacterized protein n=1 Tax=Cystoisospora suis TaxID=483139 RepID=A0A2C6K9N3_9APIC|nr:hypothetical protein CSUI_004839 [Cystoisospora suis]
MRLILCAGTSVSMHCIKGSCSSSFLFHVFVLPFLLTQGHFSFPSFFSRGREREKQQKVSHGPRFHKSSPPTSFFFISALVNIWSLSG